VTYIIIIHHKYSCVLYLASSDFAHAAGGGEVIWVKVGEGQFVEVKVTGWLAQTQ